MISDTIRGKIQDAMKKRNLVRLETLKMLSAALVNAEIAKKRVKLTEDEELKAVYAEVKKRKDAIEAYENVGAHERADKEKEELAILNEFLPEELTSEELQSLIDATIKETGVTDVKDMGRVIGDVMQKAKGRADGKKVAEIVKTKLT